RFGAAGEHDVGIAVLDHPCRVADRVRAGRAGRDHRVVRAHQAVLDRHLAADQVDQPPVDEMRAHTPRSLLVEDQRFLLDPRQAADARTDRAAGAQPNRFVHLGKPGIFDRLPRSVESVDDERIDLALDLVIDTLVGIEAVLVIRRLHFAGDTAFLVGGIELGDRPCPALASKNVGPARLDIAAQRGDEAQPGYDHTAHTQISVFGRRAALMKTGSTPFGLSLFKPARATPNARDPAIAQDYGRTASRRELSLVLFDIAVRVANGVDLLGGVVRDFDSELFLEGHNQFNDIEAVGAQIVDEARVRRDLVFLDAEMLDDDLLHAVGGVAHILPSRSGVEISQRPNEARGHWQGGRARYIRPCVRVKLRRGRLRRLDQADVQFAQLLGSNRRRRAHHQIFRTLVEREERHLADVRLVGEQHDDTVDAGSCTAVRRGAVLERVDHAREVRVDLFLRIAGDAEGLVHDVRPVVPDRPRAQLDAVANDVVLP